MTDQEFRAALDRLGLNQSDYCRTLQELGDPRAFETIRRSVANYARGIYAVPGETVVTLTLLERLAAKGDTLAFARRAAKATRKGALPAEAAPLDDGHRTPVRKRRRVEQREPAEA
jgi:hypothetical protein